MEQLKAALESKNTIIVNDRRGQPKPAAPEVHGKVAGYVPAHDYVLVRRLASVSQDGMIVRPEVAIELAERGYVVAVGSKAKDIIPLGVIATFSKYGAEEKSFDDSGQERYAQVRWHDVRGWHAGN